MRASTVFLLLTCACSDSGTGSGSGAGNTTGGGSPIVGTWGTTTTTADATDEDYWTFATDGKATRFVRHKDKSGTATLVCFDGSYRFADATLTTTSSKDAAAVTSYQVLFLDNAVRLKRDLDAGTSQESILSRVPSVPTELRLSCAP